MTERERGRQREPAQPAVTVARTAEALVPTPLFVAVVRDGWRSGSAPASATYERAPRPAAVSAVAALTIAVVSDETDTGMPSASRCDRPPPRRRAIAWPRRRCRLPSAGRRVLSATTRACARSLLGGSACAPIGRRGTSNDKRRQPAAVVTPHCPWASARQNRIAAQLPRGGRVSRPPAVPIYRMCWGARLGVARAWATAWVTDLLFCRASRRPIIWSRSYSSRPSGVRSGAGKPYRSSHKRSVSALTLSTVAASLIVSVAQPSFTGCIGSRVNSFSSFGNRGRLSYRPSAPIRQTSGSQRSENGLREDQTRTRGLTNGQATRLAALLAELRPNPAVAWAGKEPGAVCACPASGELQGGLACHSCGRVNLTERQRGRWRESAEPTSLSRGPRGAGTGSPLVAVVRERSGGRGCRQGTQG